jgi:hypothetical protein
MSSKQSQKMDHQSRELSLRDHSGLVLKVTGLVLGGLVGVLVSRADAKHLPALLGAVVGLLITILFLQIGELTEKDRFKDVLGTYQTLQDKPGLHHVIQRLIEFHQKAHDEYSTRILSERADEVLQRAVDDMAFLADGRRKVEVFEDLTFTLRGFEVAEREVLVSSYLDLPEYWTSSHGRAYVDVQREFIERKIGVAKILRIFIVDRAELQRYEQIIRDQVQAGIEVRVALREDIPDELLSAYVIYDEAAVRMETFVRGIYKSSVMSFDLNEVRQFRRSFQELSYWSLPWTEHWVG